jgi:polar amino acid transport system permease protein
MAFANHPMNVSRGDRFLPVFRRRWFLVATGLALVVLFFVLLPDAGEAAAYRRLRLVAFWLLLGAWAVNILADRFKPLWLHGAVSLLLVAGAVWTLLYFGGGQLGNLGHIFFNMEVMRGQWGLLWSGLWVTVKLAAVSIVLSTAIGLVVAILRIQNNPVITVALVAYLEFCRTIPILVALILFYFGFPFLGIAFSAFTSGVIVITFLHAAYIGEAFRSGILALNRSQKEASYSLGMTPRQTLQHVLVPQAFRIVLPSLANQWIGIIKDTSVCSLLAITELLKAAQIIATWKANPTPLVMSTIMYLTILVPLTVLTMRLEARTRNRTR